MINLSISDTLKSFNLTEKELVLNLTNILVDEEYIDENLNPIMCYHCDSTNIEKFHKVEYFKLDESIKLKIKEICSTISRDAILTYWYCKDCNEIVCIKIYEHKSAQDKKIYYTQFDIVENVLKYLQSTNYLSENYKPKKCFICESNNIEEIVDEDDSKNKHIICKDCNKKLGISYEDKWYPNYPVK